jgi:hypothetical protein
MGLAPHPHVGSMTLGAVASARGVIFALATSEHLSQ